MLSEDDWCLGGIVCLKILSCRSTKNDEWRRLINFSAIVSFVLTSFSVFSVPVTGPITPPPQPCQCLKCQDVEDVKFVINYDYPNSSEDYIHRIGRTARSTNKGTAYTFFTPGNLRQARELIRVLEEARQAINPKLLQLVDTGRGGGGGGGGKGSTQHHYMST